MKKAMITNIQRFSVHDGPGIRTSIFFKGCPLSCIWCHNPETQKYTSEILFNKEKCTLCGVCVSKCVAKGITIENGEIQNDFSQCTLCENCVDFCINNTREIAGKEYSLKELVEIIEKDNVFYEESGGGVTLSGGEVMAQIEFVEALTRGCHEKGISVAIDTCGYAPFESYEKILDYVDIFLYDIKIIHPEKHRKYTGKSSELILENLEKLSQRGANIHIRIPIIEGINSDDASVREILNFLKGKNIKTVSLLPYHDIGKSKYKRLQQDYREEKMATPSEKRMEEIKRNFENQNYEVKIGG